MAKISGLGWTTLNVDNSGGGASGIRNDVTNFQFSTPIAVQDVTGVDKSAIERIALLADFSITLNGVFNSALSHTVFNDINAGNARTTALAIDSQTLSCETLYTDYAITRSDAGELTWSAPGVLSDGTVPNWS